MRLMPAIFSPSGSSFSRQPVPTTGKSPAPGEGNVRPTQSAARIGIAGPLAIALLGLVLAAPAAQTSAGGRSQAPAAPAAGQTEIPKSVFIIPATPQEGKDPFFPQSTRMRKAVVFTTTTTTKTPVAAAVDLELKGISGTVGHRLAIINNRTFESGEEGDVNCTSGRVRIVCREIKADAVLVWVNGVERILRLRAGS